MQLLARWHLNVDVSCMHLFKKFDRHLTSSSIPTYRDPLQPSRRLLLPGPRVHSPPDVADAGGAETREAAGRCTGRWPNIAAGGGHSVRQLGQLLKWNEFRSHWEKWWFMFMIWMNLLILVVFLNIELPFSFHMIISNWTLGKWSILKISSEWKESFDVNVGICFGWIWWENHRHEGGSEPFVKLVWKSGCKQITCLAW